MRHDDEDLPVLTDLIVAGLSPRQTSRPEPAATPPSPATPALADAQRPLRELTVPWTEAPAGATPQEPAAPADAPAWPPGDLVAETPVLPDAEFDVARSLDTLGAPFASEAPPPNAAPATTAADREADASDAPARLGEPAFMHAPDPGPTADAGADTGAIVHAGDAFHAPQPGGAAVTPPADTAPAPAAVDVAALGAALGAALDARLDDAIRTLRAQLRSDLQALLRDALTPTDQDPSH